MASDNVWLEFQPKVTNSKCSSNLSQISSFSLGSQSRLSLSNRTFTAWSSQVQHRAKNGLASSSKNPPMVQSTPCRTSTSSPKQQTPTSSRKNGTPKRNATPSTPRRTSTSSTRQQTPTSSRKKATPKQNGTPDGFVQRRIDNYFGSETKQITSISKINDIEIVDLTFDGEKEEDIPKAGRRGFSNESHPTLEKLSNVSRVLFPPTSQIPCERRKQLETDCNSSVRGKENLNVSPCLSANLKDAGKSRETQADVFKAPRPFKYKAATFPTVNKTTNNAQDDSTSSDFAKAVSPSTSKGEESYHTSKEEEEGNDSSKSRKSTGNEDTSSKTTDFNGGNHSVKVSEGKNNLVKKKKVEIEPTKEICSTKNNPEQVAPQTRDLRPRTTHEIESFENFTGVTECVSVPSSGELWTPSRQTTQDTLATSDSDDFEKELPAIKRKQSLQKKNHFHKVRSKNLKKNVAVTESKQLDNMKVIGKSTPKDSSKKHDKIKISCYGGPAVARKFSGASRSSKNDKLNKNQESLEEDFSLSGGFFPEEDGNEKVHGQAFVIRSPSQEYLSCWDDLMEDSSITVERELVMSDSEKSSILADLSALDRDFDESAHSVLSSSTVIPNKSEGNSALNDSLFSKTTVETPKENNPTLPYLSNLSGISLSASQWDNIPDSQESPDKIMDVYANKTLLEKSCDVNPRTESSKVSPGNVTPTLLEGYNKRASSPHEAEVAPRNIGFGVRRSPDAQILETSPEKATMDLNSPTGSISYRKGYSPEEIINHEYSSCDELSSSERVQEWISTVNENRVTDDSGERVNKAASLITKKLTQHYPVNKHKPGAKKKWTRKRCKTCDIKCQVKIILESNPKMNDSVIKNVKRMKCVQCPPNKENQKTAANLGVGVQMNSFGSENSTHMKRMPIKVQVKYGKWGWEEIEIDCEEEVKNHCDDSTSVPATLCVQEVAVNICNCSRHMQVDCIISKETVLRAALAGRSRYSTSLRNYISHWGLGDNPISLSAVAYCKLFNSSFDDSSSIPHSEKDTVIVSSAQFDSQISADFHNTVNSSSQMTSDSLNLSCTTKERQEPSHNSESEELDTPSGLSDDFQEWMSQPVEVKPSKSDAVSQWAGLMKRMNSGSSKSSSISFSSKSASISSLSSLGSETSQGTSVDEQGCGRRSYGRERKPRVCPFYKIIQGTKFVVDAFSYGAITGISHYFLSHFHYDHYMGLTKKFAYPIYCSSVTARLVALKIKVDPSLLRRIDPGQTVTVENTKVTALDANHCPGSVMFLFELPNGKTHLHCGDFRAHPCMESYHALWNVDIDKLYLDTTYCDPTYNFPSQQEIIKDILTLVTEELENEPKTLIVCGSYTIGKERVFAAIAENLKAKIWAPYDKFRVLQCVKEGLQDLSSRNVEVEGGAGRELGLIQALSLLTKLKEEAQVHVLPMAYLKKMVLEEHLYSIKGMAFNKVVAFRPTGWAHGRTKGINLVLNSPSVKIYEAAYSEHSSFSEMARFVRFIRPKQVIKTVNVGSPRKRQAMEKHINSWLALAKSKVPIPDKNNESPKSAKVLEEQKKAGFFQPRTLSKTKLLSRIQFMNASTTYESPEYAALSTQTSLSRHNSQESGFSCSASRVGIKRACAIAGIEELPKRRLI